MKKIKKKTSIKGRNQVDIPELVLTKPLLEKFQQFLEYHPANRFSRNLRTMLMEFLMCEGATESEYWQDLLYDLEGLFELLGDGRC